MSEPTDMKGLMGAVVAHARRTAPEDEYGVHFLDADGEAIGWARAEHCGSFEVAVPKAIDQICRISAEWKIQHDDFVRSYVVTHHESGEVRKIFRSTA